MNKEEKIIAEAKEYINNDLTVADTAKILGISKRTLQLHFKALEHIDLGLHNLVVKKQKSNMMQGRIIGGTKGKREKNYTREEAINIANAIIDNGWTYREAEEALQIPSSTIYEIVHSEYIDELTRMRLDILATANNKHQSQNEYLIEAMRK